jgi:hypothetical protein
VGHDGRRDHPRRAAGPQRLSFTTPRGFVRVHFDDLAARGITREEGKRWGEAHGGQTDRQVHRRLGFRASYGGVEVFARTESRSAPAGEPDSDTSPRGEGSGRPVSPLSLLMHQPQRFFSS